jgi:signal transduction histidine kinase
MLSSVKGRIILAVMYIFFHFTVLIGFWKEESWRNLPETWNHQFVFVILLMMLLACLMPFLKSVRLSQAILFLRLLLTLILAIPSASYPGSFGLIYAVLTLDGFLYLSGFYSCIPGLLSVFYLTLLANLRISFWNHPANPVDVSALVTAWAQCVLCFVLGFYLNHEQRLRARDIKKVRELKVSNQSLADTNIKLQNIAAQIGIKTEERERTRIAREIHDTVAYTLTNLLSLLDAYRERLQESSQNIPEEVLQARSLVRDGLYDVRVVLRGLRPEKNEGSNRIGDVKRLINVFGQATGIKIDLEYGDIPQYPGKNIEEVLYRVVQEGLTNSFRHGQATEVFVHFYCIKNGIGLTICDNGLGTETYTGGFGLLGIKERVETLGGLVSVDSQLGKGFTLRVWMPLTNEEEVENGATAFSHCR